MPDNVPIRPANGAVINAATDVLSDNSHSPKVTLLSGSGDPTPISPATSGKQDQQIAGQATIGTRAYGTVQRIGVASATALSTPIAATEVLLHASVKQYVLAVAGTGTPTVSAATGIPLEAGEKFHMRITSGQRIATIREDTDGFLHIAPVA